jgi:hypothetical protein
VKILGPESGWRVSRQTVAEASRLSPVRSGRDARTTDWSETLLPLFHKSWRAAVYLFAIFAFSAVKKIHSSIQKSKSKIT